MDTQTLENKTFANKSKCAVKKYFFIILAVALVFFGVKIVKSVFILNNAVNVEINQGQNADASQKVRSFSITGFSEDGKTLWELGGETANIFSETVDMYDIKGKYFAGKMVILLTADEGTFNRTTKDVELRKNIVAHTDEGTTFKTGILKWLGQSSKAVTDDFVYIERKNAILTGKGAQAEPSKKRVRINKDVTMTINPAAMQKDLLAGDNSQQNVFTPEKQIQPIAITCDGPLVIDYNRDIAYFYNAVIIKDQKGNINSDHAVAYINSKTRRLYKAVARGHVSLTEKENISYCREIIYMVDESRAILRGRPKVILKSLDQNNADSR